MSNALLDDDGQVIPGYLVRARPEAVIIAHEIFGLTNHIRGVVKRFANEGFTAFAPDFFGGQTTDDEATGRKLVDRVRWKDAMERVRLAHNALSRDGKGTKVAIIGFGFGGQIALAAAQHVPALVGCVTFYGIPTVDKADLVRISCRVQGHFGSQDRMYSKDRVNSFEARLKEHGISVEVHRYHTGHFFFNEVRKVTHSPYNSELAFRRTVAFAKMSLVGSYEWPIL